MAGFSKAWRLKEDSYRSGFVHLDLLKGLTDR
jgi:hypothetical protein